MATPIFCCGGECGYSPSGGTGFHWGAAGGISPTYSTSIFHGGAGGGVRSVRSNSAGSIGGISTATGSLAQSQSWNMTCYFYIATAPDINAVYYGYAPAGVAKVGLGYKTTDSKWYPASDDGVAAVSYGSTGVTLPVGAWHKLSIIVNFSANPWTLDMRVDDVAFAQFTIAKASQSAAAQAFTVGAFWNAKNFTADLYIDDMVMSNTAADYPLAVDKILGFYPNADGTHTFTTTIGLRGTTGAPTGGGNIAGSSDSFNWLNGRPLPGGQSDNTRLWNQAANGSTLYGEVQFEDYAGIRPPRAVEVCAIQLDASTGTGDSTFKLNDNGTENTILATGAVAGTISEVMTTKQYATMPADSAAWTLTRFNALRFRFGYSADANPDHYCRGVMIEAEFPEDLPIGTPFGIRGQRQQQQLMAL